MISLDALPSIRGLTPIDNLIRFFIDTDRFLERCRSLGPLVRLRLPGPVPILAVHGPREVEQVLITKNRSFIKDRNTRRILDVVGNGLLVSEGEFWRRQRRLAQPAFARQHLAHYGATIVDVTRRHTDRWREGATVDLSAAMMDLAREVVTSTLLSSELGRRANDLGDALDHIMARFSDWRFGVFPTLGRLPLAMNARFDAARAQMIRIVDGIIAERRANPADHGDLLTRLLEAQDDDGTGMTDEQLRSELLVLLLAGHETTALALTWTFALLAMAPRAWHELRRELDREVGERPLTAADVPRLPYLEAVVLEGLRLRPPAWSVGREAVEDVEIAGVRVPAGCQLWMFAWSQHRDARLFPRPLDFRPERWEGDLLSTLPRCAYFPFGGGPRLCIGKSFAMLEATLILGTIAQRWQPEVVHPERIRPTFSLTLRTHRRVVARIARRPTA
jgi:cytochrome P450